MKKTTTIDLDEMLSSDAKLIHYIIAFYPQEKEEDKSNEEEVAGSGTLVAVGGGWVVRWE